MSFETVIHLVCFCHAFYEFKGILLTAVQINILATTTVSEELCHTSDHATETNMVDGREKKHPKQEELLS